MNPISRWDEKPVTAYQGVEFSCQQLWKETRRFWPLYIVQARRLRCFMTSSWNGANLLRLRSLSIEIPFDTSMVVFSQMAQMFLHLTECLQVLRLYFIGKDRYGRRVYIHGCGNLIASYESTRQKLPIEGQEFLKRLSLVNTIAHLGNLHTLVLSNLNLPLLQAHIIGNKRKLARLHMETDPRSTLHLGYADEGLAWLLAPVRCNFPPITQLYLSANGVISALQVACSITMTLKHLTWVVPDPSRQAGNFPINWYRDTNVLLCNLSRKAPVLETLRICIEGRLHDFDTASNAIHHAFRSYLPDINSLRTFELHLKSSVRFLGAEVVRNLPPQLRRLYLSDGLIGVGDLCNILSRSYLGEQNGFTHLYQTLFPTQLASVEVVHRSHQDLIGEDLDREDFIPLNYGDLGFVGYEYDPRHLESIALELRYALLRINGLLLDREHNRHLAEHHGKHIRPRVINVSEKDSSTEDAIREDQIWDAPTPSAIQTNASMLQMTKLALEHEYFGLEDEAEIMFIQEPVIRIEEVTYRTYPHEVEKFAHEHWISQ